MKVAAPNLGERSIRAAYCSFGRSSVFNTGLKESSSPSMAVAQYPPNRAPLLEILPRHNAPSRTLRIKAPGVPLGARTQVNGVRSINVATCLVTVAGAAWSTRFGV